MNVEHLLLSILLPLPPPVGSRHNPFPAIFSSTPLSLSFPVQCPQLSPTKNSVSSEKPSLKPRLTHTVLTQSFVSAVLSWLPRARSTQGATSRTQHTQQGSVLNVPLSQKPSARAIPPSGPSLSLPMLPHAPRPVVSADKSYVSLLVPAATLSKVNPSNCQSLCSTTRRPKVLSGRSTRFSLTVSVQKILKRLSLKRPPAAMLPRSPAKPVGNTDIYSGESALPPRGCTWNISEKFGKFGTKDSFSAQRLPNPDLFPQPSLQRRHFSSPSATTA